MLHVADFVQQWQQLINILAVQDRYEYEETPSSTGLASQGINAGVLGTTSRVDSLDGDDDDIFVDAPEDLESVSFTSTNTSYTQLPADTGYNQQPAGSAYTSSYKQPYVNQTGPPMVDTSNDPDDTFGPVKPRQGPAQPAAANQRGTATFGDDDDYEGTGSGTPGKKGFRAKMKGKLGAKKEHHQEKKRTKANEDLDNKMHEKEIPKAQAVTVSMQILQLICYYVQVHTARVQQNRVSTCSQLHSHVPWQAEDLCSLLLLLFFWLH